MSCSIFFLTDERIGNLCIVASNNTVLPQIKSQMEIIVRAMWSNPCNHGARIVATVLNNPTYMDDWYFLFIFAYEITLKCLLNSLLIPEESNFLSCS